LTLFGKIQHNYPLLDKIKENLGENQENSVFFIIKFYSLKKNADFVGKTHLGVPSNFNHFHDLQLVNVIS